MEVTNLNEFIDYVEIGIVRAKSRKHNNFGTFDTKFASGAMPYNVKDYFEKVGYSVELTECQQCKSFDLIFSWSPDMIKE